ncbi:hypothetical protein ACJJTC_010637, partial [Scirpophaga incertulas]
EEKFDIILLTEPYTGNTNLVKPIPGYTIYQHHNTHTEENSRNKTAIAMKRNKYSVIPIHELTNQNITTIQISNKAGHKINIYSIYIEPKTDKNRTLNKLEEILNNNRNITNIITGDLNAWSRTWGSVTTNTRGTEINNMFNRHGIITVNDENNDYTFLTTTHGQIRTSNIDITAITEHNYQVNIINWKTNKNLITTSDHLAITYQIKQGRGNKQINKNISNNTWKYDTTKLNFWNKEKTKEFEDKCKEYIDNSEETLTLIATLNKTEINTYIESLTNKIILVCQETLPKYKSRPGKPHWWNDTLEEMKIEVIRIHHQMSKIAKKLKRNTSNTPNDNLQNALVQKIHERNEARSKYHKAIQQTSSESFRDFCNTQNPNDVWTVTNKLTKTNPLLQTPGTFKKEDGTYTESIEETCEILAKTLFPDDTNNNRRQETIKKYVA